MGSERRHSQTFWLELLSQIYGIEQPGQFIRFEEQVKLDHTSFIDGYIPKTRVMIEQKGLHRSLTEKIRQSDGTFLTPYEQAKRYADELPLSQKPRWIVTCNFEEFHVHDMEHPREDPAVIRLEDLPHEFYRLQFLVDVESRNLQKEQEVSVEAGRLVGALYEALMAQYKDPDSPETRHSLNVLCVRLVFCLYAEDSGLFSRHNQFYDYMKSFKPENMRKALVDLFEVLDQQTGERDPYMEEKLASFPYIDGGLFSRGEKILIPPFNDKIIETLLEQASLGFDWSGISPTIFGAVFESTLNPVTRREGGMYYTSVENIHKVIDPLFLDNLRGELDAIKAYKDDRTLDRKLRDFTAKLSKLTFLDPACGSGNFLTETYLCLRRLENEALRLLFRYAQQFSFADPVQVTLAQFYGIEINDFAVTVARTALWIAEHQMVKQTESIINQEIEFLPLKSYSNIRCANALRLDWSELVKPQDLGYIVGNPPFQGARVMNAEQKADVLVTFGRGWKNVGNLDYVACWYWKAADFMAGTSCRAALVSTNSVCQGENVANLWRPLFAQGVHFDFAHRTFRWDNEALDKAHVYCIIVGFSTVQSKPGRKKAIFDGDRRIEAHRINAYLLDADDAWIASRSRPLCDVPEVGIGNKPIDGGFYLFTQEEMDAFVAAEPAAAQWFRPWYGAKEFINGNKRYCLFLQHCPPSELRRMPRCLERIEAVRNCRLASVSSGTRKLAATPLKFHVENFPTGTYILVPRVSSERRTYVPMGFMSPEDLTSDSAHIIPDATLYHFGILESSVHMAWMRTVCGRLKRDYRYSKDVVYNNFVWPNASDFEKEKIGATAQAILDARELYPETTLADLYDPLTMPLELRQAHEQNDRAVLAAYGLKANIPEPEIVTHLFRLYETKVTEGDLVSGAGDGRKKARKAK
ncbi:MAG: class I SAM-dependent DNA methyltransferase [Succinivibrio sp.]|nr:class I SAM-dependent DNA methyltransferase [Succinivibrio sp.]